MATDRQLADVLSEFARTMASDFPIQGILDHLVRRIVDILPVTGAGVTLISSTTSPHDVAASDAMALRFEKLQTELGEGPCLSAYRSGEAVVVPDLRDRHPFTAFGPRALEAGLAAVFTFPLRHNAGQLGALDLYRDTPGPLSRGRHGVGADAGRRHRGVPGQRPGPLRAAGRLRAVPQQLPARSPHRPPEPPPPPRAAGARACSAACAPGHPVAILFVDLDRFKLVNDSHGHLIGDELLVAVADRMASLIRPGDTLARLSGDEFVIVCEAITKKLQIHLIARPDRGGAGVPVPAR